MLSGNGRHRRPRQAPALLVTAGVTGSAIALPLIGASAANAADGTTWDRVAECESGGSWSADTGNGYFGGLQLSQDDWEQYGGLAYAPSPDQASRSQQIAVAEKILAHRGPGAWRTCALLAGLTRGSGAAKVDTGVGGSTSGDTDLAAGSRSSHSGDRDGESSSADSSDAATPSAGTDDPGVSDPGPSNSSTQDPDSPSAPPASSPSEHTSTDTSPGRAGSDSATPSPGETGNPATPGTSAGNGATVPGAPSATPTAPDRDEWDGSGQVVGASALVDTGALGSGRHRGPSADESDARAREAATGRHASRGVTGGTYTVRSGDSLSSIADSFDVHGGWQALYAANKSTVGADPDYIVAGQQLDVPGQNAHVGH
ncbi:MULTISPECIES: transglycosylase family protein [Streptomyces]|uniref:LysM peptidoglycan-binding domain-containing protein n=1 Tax=Streptomyces thermoviolaceus subsp. thermoviolaceus TaxID=66860 RepID=A0ABX0YZA8_STRTL|nr:MULTISPECIES: transglycosylase family protein [Streptomyces]MCM3264748.1 transglycosylase family protein [Streptomyces thermoviolaceus]NJP16388.1 LysM peptidoglycan-binding domain-containing protein [Streptomyces thermoviolaceus subsp. thermoviolaceus]RSS07277.1 LysM peptidoglycan-binding domain-containing protein [Streptomyces sp. WAC00469]WTD48888.1 transglycosylase family protein [Streptomyces thermoviolaceus]GGV81703.1 peptidoglycan-binding protein LysM [Streptomyces thermoviolaceus sub